MGQTSSWWLWKDRNDKAARHYVAPLCLWSQGRLLCNFLNFLFSLAEHILDLWHFGQCHTGYHSESHPYKQTFHFTFLRVVYCAVSMCIHPADMRVFALFWYTMRVIVFYKPPIFEVIGHYFVKFAQKKSDNTATLCWRFCQADVRITRIECFRRVWLPCPLACRDSFRLPFW